MALALGKPLIPLRKPGKLPWKVVSQKYDLEYGSAELQMHEDALQPGQRALLIDDVLATGGTIKAAAEIVRKVGAIPVAALFILELSFLEGKKLVDPLPTHSLLTI
jgi:adenine phosphoribosyltransferase